MQRYSVGHVFKNATHGYQKYSTLTSCDTRLHTTTSSTIFTEDANNPNNADIKRYFLEEMYLKALTLENSVLTEYAVNKTKIEVMVTL